MAKYDVCKGGGLRKSDKCRQGGGGGQKTRKFCRHHLSMAPKLICAGCWEEESVLRGCSRNRLEAGESVDLMIG